MCEALDQLKLQFDKDEGQLTIDIGIQGEDIPMDITIRVNADRETIALVSHLPFVIPEDKRIDVAIATCAVNNALHDGSFDYDFMEGHLFFRMNSSFVDSEIGKDLFMYMLAVSGKIIDDFNDKFLMLAKGLIGVESFISSI